MTSFVSMFCPLYAPTIMPTHPIETSLALDAERCPDLTPFVYERLFAEFPEMKPLFCRDTSGFVRGEMLARVFELILDFIGEDRFASNMLECERITHEGYNVPAHVFRVFFPVVATAIRERLGDDWSPEFETAWRDLLKDIDFAVGIAA